MKYQEVQGDLIQLALSSSFDVIAQGNNCFCVQGAGLAPQMVKAFHTDKFPKEQEEFKGDINKLGTIDWKEFRSGLFVVNAYTQYGFGRNHENGTAIPLDYNALTLCLRKMNHIFKGKHIGLPGLIGCGLAGGDPERVKKIIKTELIDCEVTIVYLPQK